MQLNPDGWRHHGDWHYSAAAKACRQRFRYSWSLVGLAPTMTYPAMALHCGKPRRKGDPKLTWVLTDPLVWEVGQKLNDRFQYITIYDEDGRPYYGWQPWVARVEDINARIRMVDSSEDLHEPVASFPTPRKHVTGQAPRKQLTARTDRYIDRTRKQRFPRKQLTIGTATVSGSPRKRVKTERAANAGRRSLRMRKSPTLLDPAVAGAPSSKQLKEASKAEAERRESFLMNLHQTAADQAADQARKGPAYI